MRMWANNNVKNTFVIDKSNGYPVQITTNVDEKTSWLNIVTEHGIKQANPEGTGDIRVIDGKDYHWVPQKFYDRGPGGDYSDEEYKNVFLNLRYHGHIEDYESYLQVLKRYEYKYDNDKELRALVAEYINLKNLKYKKSFKKVTWKHCIPMIESNDLEKNFLKIENYLIHIFNKI